MRYVKGNIFFADGVFRFGRLAIERDRIAEVTPLDGDALSEEEKHTRILPGLVDIHSHGCIGYDVCEATADELYEMAEFERTRGITSYCPTVMALEKEAVSAVCRTVRACVHPNIKGIYLEGPFLAKEKKGAQKECFIQPPDAEAVKEWIAAAGGLAKILAIAPETEGALLVIAGLKDKIRISVAHTNADYEVAKQAFEAGAGQVTHLYNAMPPYHHRNPGVIGAVFDSGNVLAELICDGIHVHEAVIRNTFSQLGAARVILISDSMAATGMGDGVYPLGGQTVYVKGNKAALSDGTIAGSVATLFDCMRHAIEIGVPPAAAIWAATRNPAKAIGIYNEVGSLEAKKRADVLLLTEDYALLEVIQKESANEYQNP